MLHRVEIVPGGELARSVVIGVGKGCLESLSALADDWGGRFGTGVRLEQGSAAQVRAALLNAHLSLVLLADHPTEAEAAGLRSLLAPEGALRLSIVIHLSLDQDPFDRGSGGSLRMEGDRDFPPWPVLSIDDTAAMAGDRLPPLAKAARGVLTMIYVPGITGFDLNDVREFFEGCRDTVHYRYFDGGVAAIQEQLTRTLRSWATDGTTGKYFQRAVLIVLNSRAPGPMLALFEHFNQASTGEITVFITTTLHVREGDQEAATDVWVDLYFSRAWQRPDDSGRFVLVDETG